MTQTPTTPADTEPEEGQQFDFQSLLPKNPKKALGAAKYIKVSDVWSRYPFRPPDADTRLSIQEHGVLVPILVRENQGPDGQPFELVEGARRVWCSREFDFPTIPSVTLADGDQAAAALTMATTRSDNPAAELYFIEDLIQRGASQKDILKLTRMPTATIRKRLSLQNLIARLREPFDRGEIPANVAEGCAKLPKETTQVRLAELFEGRDPHKLTIADVRAERTAGRQGQADQLGLGDEGDSDEGYLSRDDLVEAFDLLWQECRRNGISIRDDAWVTISGALESLGLIDDAESAGEKVPAVSGGYVKELDDAR